MELNNWKIESLRLTAFTVGLAPVVSHKDWWVDAVGTEPDSTTEKAKLGQFQAIGGVLNGKAQLTLNIEPERVDWVLSPSPLHAESAGEQFPNIDSWENTVSYFTDIVKPWIENYCKESIRLAFGAVLLLPVDSRLEGYKKLAELLKSSVNLDVSNSTDFSYTINRPRDSSLGTEVLKINRLSKWAVVQMQFVRHIAQTGDVRVITPAQSLYACRVELDINTNPESGRTISECETVFDKLVDMAGEIAQQGDIS